MIDDERSADVMRMVRSVYRALIADPPGPEEMARQCMACLIAAAGIRLKAGGWGPWSEGGDEMAWSMAIAAFEAMDATLEHELASRN